MRGQENVPGVFLALIRFFCPPTSVPIAGMLLRDLAGRLGTHCGLAEKESWN